MIFNEESPPGFKGTVEAMKQKHGDKFDSKAKSRTKSGKKKKKGKMNPFAIAWSMYKKGNESHYKNKRGTPEKKDESLDMSFSKWLTLEEGA